MPGIGGGDFGAAASFLPMNATIFSLLRLVISTRTASGLPSARPYSASCILVGASMKSAAVAACRLVSELINWLTPLQGWLGSPIESAAPQPDGDVKTQPAPARVRPRVLPFVLSEIVVTWSIELASGKTFLTRKSFAHLARSTALPRPGSRKSAATESRGVASGRFGRAEVVTKATAFPPLVTSPKLIVEERSEPCRRVTLRPGGCKP